MPANRNALIRYKTIDKCLQNRYRQWTLEDLIDACSDALYEYEGIDKGVSRRTVQGDIQMMRSDKLGYNAPIIVIDKKYYTYEDPEYSITNIPLTDQDLEKLSESVEILKQFKGFSHFTELSGMVQKLEDHLYSQKTHQRPVIDFEKNEDLKGLEYLDDIYQSIINKRVLRVGYQSFRARNPGEFDFHPYLLKEFRNRWFVVGRKNNEKMIMVIALDRILSIELSDSIYKDKEDFDPEEYFRNVIGVTVNRGQEPERVVLFVSHKNAPYLLTKPLHHSQFEIDRNNFGVTLELFVHHNFELEKDILGQGEHVKVLEPESLKRRIKARANNVIDNYNTELTRPGLTKLKKDIMNRGSSILNNVYTSREINKMRREIYKWCKASGKDEKKLHAIRQLLQEVPGLSEFVFNENLQLIRESINPRAVLTKAIFFDKAYDKDWYVTWHQDRTINVKQRIDTEGYSGWTRKNGMVSVCPPQEVLGNTFTIRIHLDDTDEKNGALRVVNGSQNKMLTDDEIHLITENSVPSICCVRQGGVHVMKPLTLHSSSKSKNKKRRRVLHLEFSSAELPGDLQWRELIDERTKHG